MAGKLRDDSRVRLEILEAGRGKPIKRGMFPQLLAVSDADFAAAEWRPVQEDES